MPYDSTNHHRRSIRLKGYDYSQSGIYAITICCQGRECRLGKIENREMELNEFGKIASDEWMKLPERYPNITLDVFQIMPNHFHGIIILRKTVGAPLAGAHDITHELPLVGAGLAPALPLANDSSWTGASPAPTIGSIVGAYKSLVANQCLRICKLHNKHMGKLWQRNYFEHVIYNEKQYERIANYIVNNPVNWEFDGLYVSK
jgi:REP element-mobilizing transposase RayT